MEIPVEKKSSMAWLWILLALLLAALLLWWLLDDDDDAAEPVVVGTVATAPVETTAVAPLPEPVAQATGRTIADIMGNPSAFVGQTFSQDAVEVASVPTDRGFWIRDNGAQMFVLLTGQQESPINIEAGQRIRIKEGVLRDATFLQQGQIPGNLDQDTRQLVEDQKVFLALEASDVEILSGAGSSTKAPAQ